MDFFFDLYLLLTPICLTITYVFLIKYCYYSRNNDVYTLFKRNINVEVWEIQRKIRELWQREKKNYRAREYLLSTLSYIHLFQKKGGMYNRIVEEQEEIQQGKGPAAMQRR